MKKLKFSKNKQLVQGHTAKWWRGFEPLAIYEGQQVKPPLVYKQMAE